MDSLTQLIMNTLEITYEEAQLLIKKLEYTYKKKGSPFIDKIKSFITECENNKN